MFNSALPYEWSVLKPFVEPLLQEIDLGNNVFSESSRLLNMLAFIRVLDADYIPPTSILREFIGQSSFDY